MRILEHRIVRMSGAGLLAASLVFSLAGCGQAASVFATAENEAEQVATGEVAASDAQAGDTASSETLVENPTTEQVATAANATTTGKLDTTGFFTERDLTQTVDLSSATQLTVTSGQDLQITQEGVYVISGDASEATIVVEADSNAKVQLVLNGTNITNTDFPAIYVKSADKVFVTTVEGTTNTLQVTGTFVADGETNTDAAIFSRDDLVLNGLGTLQVSSTGNGITSKDDLKVTGGTIVVNATADGLEANDSIIIADGTLTVTSQKDGLHAENDEDDTAGYIYLCGGTLDINAASDGIQATTVLQIDEGNLTIASGEALEATYVQVNGGTFNLSASDDAINATTKSASMGTPTIEITGGNLTIAMTAGDTDALDSNGDLIVSGGTIDITGQFAFDFDGASSFTGGTITVNGEQITSIENSMMGGGMGGGPMGGMGPGGEDQGGGMMPGDGGMGGPRGGGDFQG